jgi:hypothetical protein
MAWMGPDPELFALGSGYQDSREARHLCGSRAAVMHFRIKFNGKNLASNTMVSQFVTEGKSKGGDFL